MPTLLLLASMSIGCTAGIGIGWIGGYARGHADGIDVGKARERQESKLWSDHVRSTGYDRLIPHGQPGHTCTHEQCGPYGR